MDSYVGIPENNQTSENQSKTLSTSENGENLSVSIENPYKYQKLSESESEKLSNSTTPLSASLKRKKFRR